MSFFFYGAELRRCRFIKAGDSTTGPGVVCDGLEAGPGLSLCPVVDSSRPHNTLGVRVRVRVS